MASINFKKEYEIIYSKAWQDYKGLLYLREDTQHGYRMEKQDLSRASMSRKRYTTYVMPLLVVV